MRVVFFGTPDFAVPSLERVLGSRHEVVLVVSKPDRPVGRHQVLVTPPVVELANRHEIATLQAKSLKGQQVESTLREAGADVGVWRTAS